MRAGSLLTVLVFWPVVSPVVAGDLIVPVSQDRWVSVYAFATDFKGTNEKSDSLAASGFAPFQADTTVTAPVSWAVASSSSAQMSQVQSDSMQASGSISANAESFDYEAHGNAQSDSHFEMTFDVTTPAVFTLSGEIVASGPQCSTTVALIGPLGPVVTITAKNQATPTFETGSLDADTFTLEADAAGMALGDFFFFFSASASYNILFTVTPATGIVEAVRHREATLVATPNPFRERTTFSFEVPLATAVDAAIFDLQGRLVRELTGSGGDRELSWDGRNGVGGLVQAGVYFVRLEGGGEVYPLKVTRLR